MMRFTPFLLWFCCLSSTVQAADRPNIILVMCDDLGWGDVGFNGNDTIKTPHLDAMAQSGLKFNRFYAHAPVCSPTRGSCLTGRHPYRYGVYFANTGQMRAKELTLAEILVGHGYATGHFGKWHLGTLTTTIKDSNRGGPGSIEHFSPPQRNGFEVCFSTEAKVPTFDPMLKPRGPGRSAWDSLSDKAQAVPYGTFYWDERGERVTENLSGDNSRVIMDRAIPFARRAVADGKPFFAVIWFHTPHLPVVAGPDHRGLYPSDLDVRTRNYYGSITAMDEQVGRLRSTLRELGVTNNTLFWFCSDNGPEGNDKAPGSAGSFRGRKRSLYEGGIRVPALLEWPGHAGAGKATDFPAVTSDYLPTILQVLGASYDGTRPIDGVSLVPVLDGGLHARPRPIGFQSRGQLAFVDNRYKLVGKQDVEQWELYDLVSDPGERTNIADQHPTKLTAMIREFAAWRESCAKSDRGEDY